MLDVLNFSVIIFRQQNQVVDLLESEKHMANLKAKKLSQPNG